jgi:hypothetical protein
VLARFDRSRLQVVITEEMVTAPEAVFAEVCRFIGANDELLPGVVGDRVNAYVTFRSRWLRDKAKHLPRPLANAIGRVNTTARSGYPELSADQRTTLRDFYRERVDRVEEIIGRRIDAWHEGPSGFDG